jgi:HK97 gp10 family phage protein
MVLPILAINLISAASKKSRVSPNANKTRARVTVEGDLALRQVLDGFKPSIQRRIQRAGVLVAARIIAKQAKANAKKIKDSGLLAKSITYSIKTYKSGNVAGFVGPDMATKGRVERHKGEFSIKRTKSGRISKSKGSIRLNKQTTQSNAVPFRYAHLVEFGAARHSITFSLFGKKHHAKARPGSAGSTPNALKDSSGKMTVDHPGAKAQPFLRPAIDSKGREANSKMREKISERIEIEAEKLARKAAAKSAKKGAV